MCDGVSGPIDQDFVDFVNNSIGNQEFIDLVDPNTNIRLGIEHLMATLSAEQYALLDSSAVPIKDFAGWAGDLITVWKFIDQHKNDNNYKYRRG
jgi:hypothetical protein